MIYSIPKPRIYIGCSGFHYPAWKNEFYPQGLASSKWFGFYSQRFNTLELNNTFYKFPVIAALQKLYHAAPPGFLFSVKVPRLITHYKQFNHCADLLMDFYMSVHDGLRDKAGPILFQLPASFTYNEDRVDKITSSLNPAFTNVVEFRHPSWWQTQVQQQLQDNGIHICGVSHPSLPPDLMGDTRITYYRFHGVPTLYLSGYSEAALQQIAKAARDTGSKEIFIYFNNTITVTGAENAMTMQHILNEPD